MTKVLIADDSAVMRRMLRDLLHAVGDIEIVGEAADGAEAVAQCQALRPDVLTLDLSMPRSTGLDVLAALTSSRSPVRVVVVSSFSPTLVERALDVLDAGATDLVAKPKPGESFADFGDAVVRAVRTASTTRVGTHNSSANRTPLPRGPLVVGNSPRVLLIASSTGGPRSLGTLIPALGSNVGSGGIIVQHMPPGFTASLGRRLDAASSVEVREAALGDHLAPSKLLVAPAGWHLRMNSTGSLRLDDAPSVKGVRPRADLTIQDLVKVHGAGVVLIVLTGMGNDGLDGARCVHEAGGIVLAQDASDCVVYGMPRHVVEQGLADATGTLAELPTLIERALATPVEG